MVCITPLISIMMDQHSKYAPCGLNTEFVSELTNKKTEDKIIAGEVQLVYISPESIVNNRKFRKMLLSAVYTENLMGLVVDEAHCVKTWGDDFRIAFSEIGTLRSLIPQHVKVMALTATCTVETLQIIKERLAMQEPEIIALSPQRPNIFYSLQPPTNLEKLSTDLADELKQDRINFKKTVLFCRNYLDCGNLYATIRYKMKEAFTDPPGYPDFDEFRMVELYTRVSRSEKREAVIKLFMPTDSKIRLIIATTAFGMGINCQSIARIIHWGLPSNTEEYVQETGRAGRDGSDAEAILYRGKTGRHASESMKAYSGNTDYCRRRLLLHKFLKFSENEIKKITKCKCCDVCVKSCDCPICETPTLH